MSDILSIEQYNIMGNTYVKGGNRRRIMNRRSKPYIKNEDVVVDINNHVEQVCQLSPNSKSCQVAKMHLNDMLNSPKGSLESVSVNSKSSIDGTFLDVYTTECPYKEDVDSARVGVCGSNVMKYVEKMVNDNDKNITEGGKDISDNEMINKAAEITNCNDAECVLSSVIRKYDVKTKGPMKPKGPRNNTDWLSNDNTDNVMKGINEEFEEFYWFSTTMIDFESSNIKSFLGIPSDRHLGDAFNIITKKLDEKYNCFGCIINTDKSSNCKSGKCGTHWVCVFVDCRKLPDSPWTIEYFDSVGDPPDDEICQWQEKLKKDLEDYRKELGETGGVITDINDIQHQKENNECGVYCSYFIRARVEGIPFSRFKNRKLPDFVMIGYRRNLFS